MHNQEETPGPRPTSGWVKIYDGASTDYEADILRQTIEHAGYRRNILRRNPKRYDEDGEELEDEDEDGEADARAAEDNPYADIHLESKQILAISPIQVLIMAINRSTLTSDVSCEPAEPSLAFHPISFIYIDRYGATCL